MKYVTNLLLFTLMSFFIALSASAEKISTADKLFYKQLSCEASGHSVVALLDSLTDQGVSQLEINKRVAQVLEPLGLTPGGPRWTCCEACVENDLPNSSAACQCCDGLGAVLDPLLLE